MFWLEERASDIPNDLTVTVIYMVKINTFFVYESTPHI